jgi:hypothetical protein
MSPRRRIARIRATLRACPGGAPVQTGQGSCQYLRHLRSAWFESLGECPARAIPTRHTSDTHHRSIDCMLEPSLSMLIVSASPSLPPGTPLVDVPQRAASDRVGAGATATAPRRDAQLLPPRRLTITDPLFGHYGVDPKPELQGQHAQRSIELIAQPWMAARAWLQARAPPGELTHWCQKIRLRGSRAACIGTARDDLTEVIDPAGSVQCHVGLQRIALGNLVIEVDRHAVPP